MRRGIKMINDTQPSLMCLQGLSANVIQLAAFVFECMSNPRRSLLGACPEIAVSSTIPVASTATKELLSYCPLKYSTSTSWMPQVLKSTSTPRIGITVSISWEIKTKEEKFKKIYSFIYG